MPGNTDSGFVVLSRSFFESWLWRQSTPIQKAVFLWLLYRARWKDGGEKWWDGAGFVEINRGECVVSTPKMAKDVGVSRGSVRKALTMLEKTGTIRARTRANRYTIVTVCNYDTYQSIENYRGQGAGQGGANPGPGRGQGGATEGNQGIRESGKARKQEDNKHAASPGFERAWNAYPHWSRRSVKRVAAKVWRDRKLEPHTESVLQWIDAYRDSDDWSRNGGSFVPGMQVWLKRPDFTDPPEPTSDPHQPYSDTTRHNIAVMNRFLEGG